MHQQIKKLEGQFVKHPDKLAEYVQGLTAELHQLGQKMIQESLEMMNRMLLESPIRRRDWGVEVHIRKPLLTSLGPIEFKKTLFTNKYTGESAFLIERILGLGKHERMTENVQTLLFQEAVQDPWKKSMQLFLWMASITMYATKVGV